MGVFVTADGELGEVALITDFPSSRQLVQHAHHLQSRGAGLLNQRKGDAADEVAVVVQRHRGGGGQGEIGTPQ